MRVAPQLPESLPQCSSAPPACHVWKPQPGSFYHSASMTCIERSLALPSTPVAIPLPRRPTMLTRRRFLAHGALISLAGLPASVRAAEPEPLPNTKPSHHGRRHRQRPRERRRQVPSGRNREVRRETRPPLEARLLLARSVQQVDRAEPQAAGPHPRRARSAGAVRRPGAGRHHARSRPWSARARATRSSPSAGRRSATCTARGCCWCPPARKPIADVVAIPDADQTPEMLVGLVPRRRRPSRSSPGAWPRAAAACSCRC